MRNRWGTGQEERPTAPRGCGASGGNSRRSTHCGCRKRAGTRLLRTAARRPALPAACRLASAGTRRSTGAAARTSRRLAAALQIQVVVPGVPAFQVAHLTTPGQIVVRELRTAVIKIVLHGA